MYKSPVFLFSVPRSGSTLLQRILAAHSDISTASEPWFLLPLIYSLRKQGTFAQYSHISLSNATADLLKQLPNGLDDYYQALRPFVMNIYGKLNNKNAIYFLDKTPRYYLIIEEIAEIFSNAKFIFLFRNPLSVMSSMINSFYRGRLGDWRHKIDLFEGPIKLSEGFQKIRHKSISIQYENLLTEPIQQMKKICDYLEITYHDRMIENFNQTKLKGSMGDQIGTRNYSALESETLEKWKTTLGTCLRKKYAEYYLKSLGPDTIKSLGYDMSNLLEAIDQLESKRDYFFSDLFQLSLCEFRTFFEIPLLKQKIRNSVSNSGKRYVHY